MEEKYNAYFLVFLFLVFQFYIDLILSTQLNNFPNRVHIEIPKKSHILSIENKPNLSKFICYFNFLTQQFYRKIINVEFEKKYNL